MNYTNEESVTVYVPPWLGRKQVDEKEFAQEFLAIYPLRWCGGSFYDVNGPVPEETVRKKLYTHLSGFLTSGLSAKVASLVEVVKLEAQTDHIPLHPDRIHLANGWYDAKNHVFHRGEHDFCRFRLPVMYNPNPTPTPRWDAFLEELLEPGDILTLQEFMGYCLIPTTKAQKMLILIGNGGEGKSRIGNVLSALMGSAMCNGSLSKVETNRFAKADLENRLVMVDDDLKMEGLPSTNTLKTLITADTPVDVERKGIQSYQTRLYCRYIAFGNGNLRSLHDRSYGFFRRQLVIRVKDRPRDRMDDPELSQKLQQELEGILKWCIAGLMRLQINQMQFVISERTRRNLEEAVEEGNNIPSFLRSEGYFRFEREAECSCRNLYSAYRDWCEDNILFPLASKTFVSWLIQNQKDYPIAYTNNCHGGDGRRVRGFRGIRRI